MLAGSILCYLRDTFGCQYGGKAQIARESRSLSEHSVLTTLLVQFLLFYYKRGMVTLVSKCFALILKGEH